MAEPLARRERRSGLGRGERAAAFDLRLAHGTPLRALACVAATAACGWAGWACLDDDGWRGQGVPLLLAAIFAGEAFFLNRARKQTGEEVWSAGYFASLAAFLYLLWIWKQVPEARQFWVLAASGAGVYAFQFLRPARFVNWIAMVFWGLAACVFALTYNQTERIFWANGVALAGLFALEQFALRRVAADLLSRQGQVLWPFRRLPGHVGVHRGDGRSPSARLVLHIGLGGGRGRPLYPGPRPAGNASPAGGAWAFSPRHWDAYSSSMSGSWEP